MHKSWIEWCDQRSKYWFYPRFYGLSLWIYRSLRPLKLQRGWKCHHLCEQGRFPSSLQDDNPDHHAEYSKNKPILLFHLWHIQLAYTKTVMIRNLYNNEIDFITVNAIHCPDRHIQRESGFIRNLLCSKLHISCFPSPLIMKTPLNSFLYINFKIVNC